MRSPSPSMICATWQSSQWRPPTASPSATTAAQADVAAPCGMVLSLNAGRPAVALPSALCPTGVGATQGTRVLGLDSAAAVAEAARTPRILKATNIHANSHRAVGQPVMAGGHDRGCLRNVEGTLSADPAAPAASDKPCSVSSGRSVPLGRPESRPAYPSVTGRDSPVFTGRRACARTCN